MIFNNKFMQGYLGKLEGNGNGIKPFFPAIFNPAREGGFLCSPEHGKLCFEALETEFVPQNNLPCWELKKRLPKSAFLCEFKMDL
jgi:hypothetical protein